MLAPPDPRKDVCGTVDGDEVVGAVNCPYRLRAGGAIYGSADGHMTKTNDLRPHLGLIGGQEEDQRPLDISVIAANMRVLGSVHSASVVSVAGTVLGAVLADDQVIVTKGGRVEGGVEAREVVLNGEVHGSVDARERLEIQASAVVHGDLHAPRLMLYEGAVVDGDVSIADESSTECQSGAASGSAPRAPGVRAGDGSSGDAAVLERDGTAPERRAWVKPMSIVGGGMIALVVGWPIRPSPSPGPTPSNPTTPVEAAVEPQISLFRASATSITLGDEVTLTWSTSLADSVHLLPDEGTVAASGSTALSPEQDTEYVLVAYGAGSEARDPIQITVAVEPDAPTIEEFSADRTTVTQGDEVTLTWNTSDADRVELEPGGPVALSGDTNVSPRVTVNYALVASGPGGETRQSVRISVAAPVPDPPIASLTAQPNTIERGGATTLTWSTTNATSVRLEPGIGTVAASGSRRVTPTGDQTYQLVATGTGGTIEREVGVTVTALENPTPPPGADDPLNRPIRIERGTFQMGNDDGADDERPVHRVTMSGFWIQEHEVTNEEYRRFDAGHQFPSGQERYPVVAVSWQQAMDYAGSRGGSLPTEAQWEFAARGAAGRTYPWGERAPTCQLAQVDGCGETASIPVMSRPDGATPEGVHDLAGNVWEWMRDWYGPYEASDALDPTGAQSGSSRVLRGGDFESSAVALRGSFRNNFFPVLVSDGFGFRVAWAGGQN